MPLQKAYSEQNTFSKQRPQWSRSKSHSAAVAQRTPSTTSKPLAAISEVTKNKLQRFHFQPPTANTDGLASKPADAPHGNHHTGNESDKENSTTVVQDPASKASFGNATMPVARLAWQDLMGVPEARQEEEAVSPSERIFWHHDRDPVSSAISPMLSRRGKKRRARSSSPTSSPSTSKPNTPAVNVKKLVQAYKSPHADPALELWGRFSLSGTENATPLGAANPMFAHLMASSSPRPPKDGVNVQSGDPSLRRAVSCGMNWPKRRRIDKSITDSPTRALQRGQVSSSKSSMVSALLETVTDEINRSVSAEAHDQAIRSPSPPKRTGPRRQDACSPTKHRVAGKGPTVLPLVDQNHSEGVFPDPLNDATTSHQPDSDYGEDDFDDDMFMEIDASLHPDQTEKLLPETSVTQDAMNPENTRQELGDLEDDFGDLDDDVFAAAETLVAEIDSNTTTQNGLGQQTGLGVQPAANATCGGGQQEDGEDVYGDDFGGDFDFDAAELAATQSLPRPPAASSTHASQKPKAIQRYLVTNVLQSEHRDEADRVYPEKILVVQADGASSIKTVQLRGDWIDTPVSAKSYVHIIGSFEDSGFCIVDNSQNMLILHPDQLISSTVIADSFGCMRRAVLQDRVKATSDPSPALVYGTLLHEIFQEALIANRWDPDFLGAAIDKSIKKHIEDLYTIKVGIPDAREHLLSKTSGMRYWAEAFVSSQPNADAFVHGRNGEKVNMCVSKLLDVEEHVWSPMYGLKGNIDATVQVTMTDGRDTKTLTVPFELKTGKNASASHQAQTVLYNLLLSDRYDIEIVYGILYYMESSQTLRIPAIRHELRHMIMQRNQLACYIRERSVQLPPMKKAKHACGKCFAQTSCFIYHKLADNGDGETSGMGDKFEDLVKHLTPTHKEFFLKWENLLTKEEKESQKLRRELWTMVSTDREKLGRCFANVVIEEGSASEDKHSPKINRFHYAFLKQDSPPGFSFLDSQLAVGEPIVVSDEKGHFALALGYVTAVVKQRITVAVDRRLHNAHIRQPGFDGVTNQVFASIMEVAPEGARPDQTQGKIKEAPNRYRLDKDEFSNGMSLVRNNLVQVMADGPFGSREIRSLVVDLVPPRFKTVSTQYAVTDHGSLNVDQKKAIDKVMNAQDYALVLGMPGTGKTTTIAHIIRALVSQGKSVLLTSYTHTAVDNILLKVKDDKIPILRLGAPAKVHPEVQDFAILACQPKPTFEEIRSAWHDTPIVATTCLGISHPVFNERTFDYCIVDEASQITLPICLGPIRLARAFVLVGDHNQLPPLVQNEEARAGGLDISLFKLLSDAHPDAVVNLEHQYRMCEDIMTLSNTLIYNGRLKCGTEELRFRSLSIPHPEGLRSHHYDAASFQAAAAAAAPSSLAPTSFCTAAQAGKCWLRDLVQPSTRVAFVNTDSLPGSREEAKGNRIVNTCEARLVTQLVEALLSVGVPAAEVGVMTHYRSQLSLLKHGLRQYGGAVELHTADRFQGRDKEVVVLSLVRSNEACSIGDLLRDWRRINVAFTRARSKLLVVGSRDTLRGCGRKGGASTDGEESGEEMLARFIWLMEERDWVYDLPADALNSHLFEDAAPTQITPRAVVSSLSPSKPTSLKKAGMRNGISGVGGEENQPPGPKRARMGERALLKGKPVLRDIMNDMMGGIY